MPGCPGGSGVLVAPGTTGTSRLQLRLQEVQGIADGGCNGAGRSAGRHSLTDWCSSVASAVMQQAQNRIEEPVAEKGLGAFPNDGGPKPRLMIQDSS